MTHDAMASIGQAFDFELRNEARGHSLDAGSDNVAWVEADLEFHRSIYLATHNEFFWPIGQLFGIALRQMFDIAAQGAHRPRAIVEHGDLCRAIIARRPEDAREFALKLLGNASRDIDHILQWAESERTSM
jgi:DNA-binding FadR family transcriptional regulator